MSTISSSHFLQQAYVLATGTAASDATLAQFASFVRQDDGGGFHLAAEPINALFGAVAAVNGVRSTVQAIALNGLGVRVSDEQANTIMQALSDAGIDTWTKLLELCIGLQGELGLTLDNRADAASSFNATLGTLNKSDLFAGSTVNASVKNLLQDIGGSAISLSNGIAGLGTLATRLTASGLESVVVDGYVAGATVFVDTNGDGVLNAGEFSATTGPGGHWMLPAHGAAGSLVAWGGTDLLTGKTFKGTLASFDGSLVVSPITSMVHTLVASGQAGTMQEATAAVRKALGLPADINLLTYDPMAVLASSTATAAQKAVALTVQTAALQLANVLTQFTVTIDAANAIAGGAPAPSSWDEVALVLASALFNGASTGTADLTHVATLTGIIQSAATLAGATALATGTAPGQIAQVTAASNTSASIVTNTTQLSQAAVISQGDAANALASGATRGDFDSAVISFTGANLAARVSGATPGWLAPGVLTSPGLPPDPVTFVARENAGVVSFSGSAEGIITVAWAGATGESVATFTRDGITAKTNPDFGGTATKVSLKAGQTLSGSIVQLKGLTIEGSGAVALTDASASAADLLAIDTASIVTVAATSVLSLTGSAEQIAAVATSNGITKAANFTANLIAGTASAANLLEIDAVTTVAVGASAVTEITGSAAHINTVVQATTITLGSNWTAAIAAGSVAASDLLAIDAATTVVVDASAVTALSGTATDIMQVYASNTAGTITGLGDEVVTVSGVTDGSLVSQVFTLSTGPTAIDQISHAPGQDIYNFSSGDSFGLGVTFDGPSIGFPGANSSPEWYATHSVTLFYEISDDGISYDLTYLHLNSMNVWQLAEAGGIFTFV